MLMTEAEEIHLPAEQPTGAGAPEGQSVSWDLKVGSRARRIFVILAWIGIPLFAGIVTYTVWLNGRGSAFIEASRDEMIMSNWRFNPSAGTSDLSKQIEASVHQAIERDEYLLDKLLMLVSVYSTILSFLALGTVIVSRQDAKEQLQKVREDTRALAEESRQRIDKIRTEAKTELKDLKEQIRAEFPIISQLQRHVLDLILELETKYPEEQNVAKRLPGSNWKTEVRQQQVLLDELQIVAVSVIVLDEEHLLKLYLALARSYLVRYQTGSQTDDDAARAYLYADYAIRSSPNNAEAWRTKGVIALIRFDAADEAGKKTGEIQDLLRSAKRDLIECLKIDPNDLGGYFNLAIIHDKDLNRSEAIRLSQEALGRLDKIPRKSLEKFLPDVSVNLACYLADEFRDASETAKKDELCKMIVDVCRECRTYLRDVLKSNKAKEGYTENMRRELKEKGDFRGLPEETHTALEELAGAPWSNGTIRSQQTATPQPAGGAAV